MILLFVIDEEIDKTRKVLQNAQSCVIRAVIHDDRLEATH